MIYQINEAIIGFPGNTLLDRVSLEIRNTEKICLVGRNGCGKTTLLKVIAGQHETENIDSDEEFFIHKGNKLRIGYLEQMSFENETKTVREELMDANRDLAVYREKLEQLLEQMGRETSDKVIEEYSKAADQYEVMGGYSYTSEMEKLFTKFGFDFSEIEKPINTFSGGQKTKIAFAKLLLSKPDICLLDEPTNHLDLPTIEWLEDYLKGYPHAVVIVSHDRMFLDRIADVTYEIEYKKMKRYVGNYSTFIKQKQLDYEKQCRDYEKQQKEIERLTIFIEKWKNTPTKVAMTRSKKMQIEHMIKIPKPVHFDTKTIFNKYQPIKESGAEVLNIHDLRLGYTSELGKVSFALRKGQRLAILGENGRGKSTLLKTIVNQVQAFGGMDDFQECVRFGRDVEWAYYDQELLNLDDTKTVIEEFWDTYPKLMQTEVRTILGNFLFSGEEVEKPVRQLSGGERVRLSLAKLMRKQANLLILDEPTNHLDMVGKEALENILKNYSGTILFVSHDRYFVKEVATSLLIFENDEVHYYPCDYEDYLEQKALMNVSGLHNADKHENKNHDNLYQDTKRDTNRENIVYDKLNRDDINQESVVLSAKEVRLKEKEKQKRERHLMQLEQEIEKQEQVVHKWQLKFTDPEIAANYEKLDEIQKHIEEEEDILNNLLLEWAGR